MDAVELKQVAQQEAERARYVVEKVGGGHWFRIMYKSFNWRELNNRWCRWLLQEEQKKLAAIIRAEGDAQGAQLLAKALTEAGGGLVELRRIEAAEDIAYQLSQSPNVIYLPSKQQALLNIPSH